MSEFISSNIWVILAVAWPVVFGLVLLALKRPSKDKMAWWLVSALGALIILAVAALFIIVTLGVFVYIPGWLFGPIGASVGTGLMFASLVYMIEYDDSDSHKQAFKVTFIIMSFAVPFFILMVKAG